MNLKALKLATISCACLATTAAVTLGYVDLNDATQPPAPLSSAGQAGIDGVADQPGDSSAVEIMVPNSGYRTAGQTVEFHLSTQSMVATNSPEHIQGTPDTETNQGRFWHLF